VKSSLAVLAGLLLLSTGCYTHYYAPAPQPVPMSQAQAVDASYRFAQSQSYNPTGVRKAVYRSEHGVWRVNLALGPPSCGSMRVDLNAFNGRVLEYTPKLHACGVPPPGYDPDL